MFRNNGSSYKDYTVMVVEGRQLYRITRVKENENNKSCQGWTFKGLSVVYWEKWWNAGDKNVIIKLLQLKTV